MKKFLTILVIFAVLAGAVSREVYSSKIIKTSVLSDCADQDDKDGGKDDSRDLLEKEVLDASLCHLHDFTFVSATTISFYSFLISHEVDIVSPYLESISQPPELIA